MHWQVALMPTNGLLREGQCGSVVASQSSMHLNGNADDVSSPFPDVRACVRVRVRVRVRVCV